MCTKCEICYLGRAASWRNYCFFFSTEKQYILYCTVVLYSIVLRFFCCVCRDLCALYECWKAFVFLAIGLVLLHFRDGICASASVKMLYVCSMVVTAFLVLTLVTKSF